MRPGARLTAIGGALAVVALAAAGPARAADPVRVDGKSGATLNAPLHELQMGGYAINGHKSAQEASVYVYCGQIPSM